MYGRDERFMEVLGGDWKGWEVNERDGRLMNDMGGK